MRTTILPNGDLELMMDDAERADLSDANAVSFDHAMNYMAECLHEQYEFVRPEVIGALTDAPILCACDDLDYSDEALDAPFYAPAPLPDAKVYWFPDYMVKDPWEELATKGRVVFTLEPVTD